MDVLTLAKLLHGSDQVGFVFEIYTTPWEEVELIRIRENQLLPEMTNLAVHEKNHGTAVALRQVEAVDHDIKTLLH